jgi:DNA-directed RNA polymerase sigma subunit (sigma70/sigma32)
LTRASIETKRRAKARRFCLTIPDGALRHEHHTLEEVGQQFSVTRERIRQIETRRNAS